LLTVKQDTVKTSNRIFDTLWEAWEFGKESYRYSTGSQRSHLSADQRSGDWLHKQTHVPLRVVLRAPCAASRSRISGRYARALGRYK
jgi:hypothetical protein